MYNMSSDTYTCDICGFEMPWDKTDDRRGEMWGCEKCGKTFKRRLLGYNEKS